MDNKRRRTSRRDRLVGAELRPSSPVDHATTSELVQHGDECHVPILQASAFSHEIRVLVRSAENLGNTCDAAHGGGVAVDPDTRRADAPRCRRRDVPAPDDGLRAGASGMMSSSAPGLTPDFRSLSGIVGDPPFSTFPANIRANHEFSPAADADQIPGSSKALLHGGGVFRSRFRPRRAAPTCRGRR